MKLRTTGRALFASLGVTALCVAYATLASAKAPDPKINPATGLTEITDTIGTDPDDLEVRHLEYVSQHQIRITVLTTSALDDLDPRIEITQAGNTWIVWWRDGPSSDRVFMTWRNLAGGEPWAPEVSLSGTDDARNPEVAAYDVDIWASYEFDLEGSIQGIKAGAINDEPDPFDDPDPFGIVGTTAYAGDPDSLIESDPTRQFLWISWLRDATTLEWSQWDPNDGTWSTPTAFPIDPYGSVVAARDALQQLVTGSAP